MPLRFRALAGVLFAIAVPASAQDMKLTYPDGRIQWMGFAQNADETATAQKSQILLDGALYLNEAG